MRPSLAFGVARMFLGIGLVAAAAHDAVAAGILVRVKTATLYVEARGGPPGTPLVIVNGGPGFAHDYMTPTDAWDRLAGHRRVVLYDQRGVGRSPALTAKQTCTLADQIEDLDGVRKSLGVERMDLFGHSWGGYLVMAYVARHPEHVSRLLICDSAAPKWSDTEFMFKQFYPDGVTKQEGMQFAEAMGDSAMMREDIRVYMGMLFWSPKNRDRYMVNMSKYPYDLRVNKLLNDDLARFDLNPELPKFKCPTLVMTGRYDANVAPSTAWKIYRAIPGARFHVFESSGHLPWFEEPDAFVTVVEEFLTTS